MATIPIESCKVFNACVRCVEQYEKFWKEMMTDDGESLLSVTEEERKIRLVTLLRMASYNISIISTTINIDHYEFNLIESYLDDK